MSTAARDPWLPLTKAKVRLSGEDGNAFSIIGRTRKAMRHAKVDEAIIEQYSAEAMSGDYDNVLQTTMRYVETS